MKNLLIMGLLMMGFAVFGQEINPWKTLGKVTYKKQFDELLGFKVDVPIFGKEVKALDGKIIEIQGYIIPVEGYKSHKEFIFSAYPYSSCFFCGAAGPETVMEVKSTEPVKYSVNPIKIKGKLKLNDKDINKLMYGLTEAQIVEWK
jgi:hypothetical protein